MTYTIIQQGGTPTLVLRPPFFPEELAYYTVDLFQDGATIVSKSNADCAIQPDHSIAVPLSQQDTLNLSPRRIGVCLRGVYANGTTIQYGPSLALVDRSDYRAPITQQ